MDITLKANKLKGEITPPPLKRNIKTYILGAILCNETSIIDNVELDLEIVTILNVVKFLGGRVSVIKSNNNRYKLKITGCYPFNLQDDKIDLSDNIDIVRFLAPILAISNKKFNIIYKDLIINNPIDSFHEIYFKEGVNNQLPPLKIKGGLSDITFFIRGDVYKDYLISLIMCLSLSSNNYMIEFTTSHNYHHYIKEVLDICKNFSIKILVNREISKIKIEGNQKVAPVNIKIENDFSCASAFFVAGALGSDIKIKNMNLDSMQKSIDILSIIEKLGPHILNEDGDIKVLEGQVKSFTIDTFKYKEIFIYLVALAVFANGTSKFINGGKISINNINISQEICEILNTLGSDAMIFDGDLIIKGVSSLKGGDIKKVSFHQVAYLIILLSSKAKEEIRFTLPTKHPETYSSFYTDYKLLGGEIIVREN